MGRDFIFDFIEAEEMVMKFRSRYDDCQEEMTAKTRTGAVGETLTKQAFAIESNINHIVNKYLKTGQLPDNSRMALAQFGDFTNVPSYKESLETVIRAQDMFSELPSAVRKRFKNNPEGLLEFLSDPENRDEAAKLGLLDPFTGKPPIPSNEPQGGSSARSKPPEEASKPKPSKGSKSESEGD